MMELVGESRVEGIAMRVTSQPWDIESLEDRELQRKKYEEDRNKWNAAVERVEAEGVRTIE